jgi:hypothetical protein
MMPPDDFKRIGIRMYGRKHWRREFSVNLGIDPSTVWRISKRSTDIPAVVEVAVRGLLEKHKVVSRMERDLREQRSRERHRYKGKASRLKPIVKKRKKYTVIPYAGKPEKGHAIETASGVSTDDNDAG